MTRSRLACSSRLKRLRRASPASLFLCILACTTPYAVHEINPVDPSRLPVSPLPAHPPQTVDEIRRILRLHLEENR